MEKKKSDKVNIESFRWIFVVVGLLLTSSLLLAAVEYDTFSVKDISKANAFDIEEETVSDQEEEEEQEEEQEEDEPEPEPEPEPEITPPTPSGFNEDAKQTDKDLGNTPPPPPPPAPPKKKPEQVFRVVEQQPEYPGGYAAMSKFIQDKIQYPPIALELGDEGKVFVEFQVSKSGKISHAKVVRGVSDELDAEALRVVKKVPNWKPGKQRGKSVACFFTIPINFRIG